METCIQFQASPAVGAQVFHRRFATSMQHHHHHPQVKKLRLIKANNGESRGSRMVAVCSGRVTTVPEWEKREFDESVITEEEMNAIGKMRGKCNNGGGIAELLECLEKEAIMGDDDGKEPTDYNRRAMIFDKSSKVFQALKDGGCTNLPV